MEHTITSVQKCKSNVKIVYGIWKQNKVKLPKRVRVLLLECGPDKLVYYVGIQTAEATPSDYFFIGMTLAVSIYPANKMFRHSLRSDMSAQNRIMNSTRNGQRNWSEFCTTHLISLQNFVKN